MHVSLLEIVDGALIEARVDDEPLWRRARVPLSELPQAERAWLSQVATRAVARLDALGRHVRFESDGVIARVDDGFSERRVPVSEAQRDLDAFLDAVQGALLIDDDAVGLSKRGRGAGADSPA